MLIVKAEVPEPETDCGLNDADAPEGTPLAERFTVPEKPPMELIETEGVALPPAVTVVEPGVALSEKSGEAAAGTRPGSKALASGEPSPVTKS